MKIDCEGAEWPILLDSLRLYMIDEIIGEYHPITNPKDWSCLVHYGLDKYDRDTLVGVLEKHMFRVEIEETGQLGKFRAWREK